MSESSSPLPNFIPHTGLYKVNADEQDSPIECSAEYHFARFTGDGATIAPLIYQIAFRLAKKSETFNLSAKKLAAYLDVNAEYVYKALRLLVDAGFLRRIEKKAGRPTLYRPISHRDWQPEHPNCCTAMIKLPYSEGDQLGRQLHGILGGETFFPNVLTGFRKSGLSDAEICDHAKQFLQEDKGKGSGKERRKRFGEYLKLQEVGKSE